VTGRQGRRCKQPLNALKEKKGYWKLTVEALANYEWMFIYPRYSNFFIVPQ